MKWPVGDFFRSLGGWFGKFFKHTKGISINVGDHEIHLNEGAGPAKPGESKFDRKPHQPGPLHPGGRG